MPSNHTQRHQCVQQYDQRQYVTLEKLKAPTSQPHIAAFYVYYDGTRYLEAPCCNTGNGFVTVDPWIAIGNFARREVRQHQVRSEV